MSRYVDVETIKPRQYENSEVELGVLAYDYDEINAMPFLDIVWCKECKYRYTPDCFRAYLEYDTQEWVVDSGDDDDFCSWGEREDE